MIFLNAVAATIGWMVCLLWLLGALGVADISLRFGPATSKLRPAICECHAMGHPEQCDEGSGCRWLQKLQRRSEAQTISEGPKP